MESSIRRQFGWGLLVLADAHAAELPDHDGAEPFAASGTALLIAVRHATDAEVDRPPVEVEVTVSVTDELPAEAAFTCELIIASGLIEIGDADHVDTMAVAPGRWQVQVATTPRDHPQQVNIVLKRLDDNEPRCG